jgi:hypothetical protein
MRHSGKSWKSVSSWSEGAKSDHLRTCSRGFRTAGGNAVRQPSTYGLLGGYFSKEDLSSLFCGGLTKAQTEERKALAMNFLNIIAEIPPGQRRIDEITALKAKYPKPPHVVSESDKNAIIRFDLSFDAETPVDRPQSYWFDHAIVHDTSHTYSDDTLRFLTKHDNVSEGPAFHKMMQKKLAKYAALIAVAKRLTDDRKIDFQPFFLFPIISSSGFMNQDFGNLIKFVIDQFRDKQKKGPPREDGVSPKVVTGRFKVLLRNSLCFALLKGNALAVFNQGVRHMSKPP